MAQGNDGCIADFALPLSGRCTKETVQPLIEVNDTYAGTPAD